MGEWSRSLERRPVRTSGQTSLPSRHPPIHPIHSHLPDHPHHHTHPLHPHAYTLHVPHPPLLEYLYQTYPPPPGYLYAYPPQGYRLSPLAVPPPPLPLPPPQPRPALSPRVKTEDDDAPPKHGTLTSTNRCGGATLSRVPQVDGPAEAGELEGMVGAIPPRSRADAEDG